MQTQAPEQELELPEDMALDGDQAEEDKEHPGEDKGAAEDERDSGGQSFPEPADAEGGQETTGDDEKEPKEAGMPEQPLPEEGGRIVVICQPSS